MPIASHFELEPLILSTIDGLALPGLTTVEDESRVAGVQDITQLLPAAILFTAQGEISEGADGRVQTEAQYWQLSIIVPHYQRTDSTTTASVAGAFLYPILQALVGQSLHADIRPLEIVDRPPPVYERGWAEFPVILRATFDIEGA